MDKPTGNMELSEGLAMASVGPRGMGATCGIGSFSFRDVGIMSVGESQGITLQERKPVAS